VLFIQSEEKKMKTNKLMMRFLTACTLLVLLFTAACGMENTIQSPDGMALAKQGNAFMNCLKDIDYDAVYDMLTPSSQQLLDWAEKMASGIVDVERLIRENVPILVEWSFDSAKIFTENGSTKGILDGVVDYLGGKRGKVHLEFEQLNGTWKVRGWTLGD